MFIEFYTAQRKAIQSAKKNVGKILVLDRTFRIFMDVNCCLSCYAVPDTTPNPENCLIMNIYRR